MQIIACSNHKSNTNAWQVYSSSRTWRGKDMWSWLNMHHIHHGYNMVTGYTWLPIPNNPENLDLNVDVSTSYFNEWRKWDCSSDPCLYHQIIRTCKVTMSRHVGAVGIHIIQDNMMTADIENHCSCDKHTLPYGNMPNKLIRPIRPL